MMNTTNLVIALLLLIALRLTGSGSREASIFEIPEDTQMGDLTE